jgi:hypothetical protein
MAFGATTAMPMAMSAKNPMLVLYGALQSSWSSISQHLIGGGRDGKEETSALVDTSGKIAAGYVVYNYASTGKALYANGIIDFISFNGMINLVSYASSMLTSIVIADKLATKVIKIIEDTLEDWGIDIKYYSANENDLLLGQLNEIT